MRIRGSHRCRKFYTKRSRMMPLPRRGGKARASGTSRKTCLRTSDLRVRCKRAFTIVPPLRYSERPGAGVRSGAEPLTARVHRLLLFVFLGLTTLLATGQVATDSLVRTSLPGFVLREVTEDEQQRWKAGDIRVSGATTLPELLRGQPGLFIKQAAPGQLATSSLRGGAAGHTAVLWNGLPLSSPQLGLLDLSFLPTHFLDRAALNTGGQAAIWGSGAVSGTIQLHNQLPDYQGFHIGAGSTVGSFGRREWWGDAYVGGKRFRSRTRVFRQRADNDFLFRPLADLPEQGQAHARFEQEGLLQEWQWRDARQRIDARTWWQRTYRELPPLTTQRRSEATQADNSQRSQLAYRRTLRRGLLRARLGHTRERIDYQDPRSGIAARSGFTSWIGEVEHATSLGRWGRLNYGLTHIRHRADAEGYPLGVTQIRTGAFAGMRSEWKAWTAHLYVRQERSDGRWLPFLPNLEVGRALHEASHLQLRLSRNYRLPTLNDRFWQPGGNALLRPESGWSQEVNYRYRKGALTYTAAGYHRLLRDWILWAPDAEQGFYTATNLTRVRSYGTEQAVTYKRQLTPTLSTTQRLGYSFTRSVNQVSLSRPALAAGQQLWYVPRHQWSGRSEWTFREAYLHYLLSYTGSVFGLNEELASYWLHDLRAGWSFEQAAWSGRVSAGVHNLFNTWYQAVERRPAPGRYYDLSFQFHFTKPTQ